MAKKRSSRQQPGAGSLPGQRVASAPPTEAETSEPAVAVADVSEENEAVVSAEPVAEGGEEVVSEEAAKACTPTVEAPTVEFYTGSATLELPLLSFPKHYKRRRFEVRLTTEQATAFAAIKDGLKSQKLMNGMPVATEVDVIRWLCEQVDVPKG